MEDEKKNKKKMMNKKYKRENWRERGEYFIHLWGTSHVVQCLLFIGHQPQLSYKKVNDKFNPHKVSIL